MRSDGLFVMRRSVTVAGQQGLLEVVQALGEVDLVALGAVQALVFAPERVQLVAGIGGDAVQVGRAIDLLAAADYAREIGGCTEIYLFGASQGGMVSALAAQLCPEKFAGLALLYPAFCIPDDWNARYPDNVPEKTILWDVALGREFFLTLRGMDVYREMPAFRKKVVLMHGTKDDIVPIRYSERAAECYPFARLIPFPGEGHGFSPPAMERVARETLALLNL